MELVHGGVVDFELAKAAANNPADFDLKMRMFIDPKASEGGKRNLQDEMTQMYEG